MPADALELEPERFSPYAPIRYRDTFWWRFARDVTKSGWVQPDGRMGAGLPDRLVAELIEPTIQAFVQNNPEGSPGAEALGLMIEQALRFRHWVPLAGQFEACGRQIFDLTEGLVDVCNNTDVKDATLEDLHLPYRALYIRFGRQEHLKLPYDDEGHEFEFLDGVFVAASSWGNDPKGPVRLMFGLTTVLKNDQGMLFPGYFLDIPPDLQKVPCLEAVDAALDLRKATLMADGEIEGVRQAQLDRYEDSAELLRAAMPLVINALFFLDGLGTENPLEPGRGTPSELVERWAQAEGSRRRKLGSRLTSEGYTLVHVVGREFDQGTRAARGQAAPCWRRGHWRWQAHGPAYSLRKRIRIAPVFVNPGNQAGSSSEAPGHIYTVDHDSKR